MSPASRTLAAALLLVPAAPACQRDDATVTQTIVLVNAEREVRRQTVTLRLLVQDRDGETLFDEELEPDWPVKLALVPKGGDASRGYRVTAEALDAEAAVVAFSRLWSGYVEGEKRFVVMVLEDACLGAECSGADETCHAGDCVEATVAPEELGSTREAAPPAGELIAFGRDARDGGDDSGPGPLERPDSGDADADLSEPDAEGRNDGGGATGQGAGGTTATAAGEGGGSGGAGGQAGTDASGSGGAGGQAGTDASGSGGAGGQAGTNASGSGGAGGGASGAGGGDPCAQANGGCDTNPMATCSTDGGGVACACPSGYTGDGVGDSGCADQDECALSLDNCDSSPDACRNEVGGFRCECPSGYMGSGVGDTCEDVLTCATNNGGCDTSPMATCNEQVGAPNTCTCPSFYATTDGGATCVDINECNNNNGGCGAPAMFRCENNVGAPPTCVDLSPIGYYDDLGSDTTWSSGYLTAIPVTLTSTRTIQYFGIIGGENGRLVSMGVYTSTGSAPGRLMALSESNFIAVAGRNEFRATAASGGSLTLTAGDYWIVGVVDVGMNLRSGPPTVVRHFASWGGLSLPAMAPSGSPQDGPALNFYMRP